MKDMPKDAYLRRAAQATSETFRYFFSSVAVLLAAAALVFLGWHGLNIAMFFLLLFGMVTTLRYMFASKSPKAGLNALEAFQGKLS